ncbi:hypothetical protein PAAG_01098 [Paracoccidioides lutzii Pb01]|uniref:Methyltransferase domain-containing protein n=1 Tax=Paracoccidioides lutzii (strain ATCC MYA-826 / Pb01) TaxID=502779 RepID=C1GRF3_PARBA|nr:hypothetical protein PAAG_01098 [Paracoccidioides lutzii Pb01]EEH38177.2 hypothetical protein PAAG_01098 [Paracoccidioides lutzii Pb01]
MDFQNVSHFSPSLTFILGLLTTPLLSRLLQAIIKQLLSLCLSGEGGGGAHAIAEKEHGLYSLDHGMLNLPSLVPEEMWMNMGYWKNTTEFPRACEALLDKILRTAGLDVQANTSDDIDIDYLIIAEKPQERQGGRKDGKDGDGAPTRKRRRVILDVGFGCGEQTLYLMKKREAGVSDRDDDDVAKGLSSTTQGRLEDPDCQASSPLFHHYIGMTIEKMQYEFAKSRVAEAGRKCNAATEENELVENGVNRGKGLSGGTVELFCGHAAKPSDWPEDIQRSISNAFRHTKHREGMEKKEIFRKETDEERYVLGLDTLYHFSPSRNELFKYSHSTLRASLLAFDLFLPPKPQSSSFLMTAKRMIDSLALRCLTPALSAPFSNFVTPAEYKTLLAKAGYAPEDIRFEDITDDVFPGLAAFFEQRTRELRALGLQGFTKWRISGWLFRWLAGGDVLRAGIIVAKWQRSPEDCANRKHSFDLQVQHPVEQSC